jgi:hypothetical protein
MKFAEDAVAALSSAFLRGIAWIEECLVVILILHTAYTLYFVLDLWYFLNNIYYIYLR